ncbi:hypothetical protein [Lactobacillus johnsonii]|nr:hypothetical protein [Lactobacillus johnsonii]QXL48404.1 hypothetical protein IGB12_04380 [Lactobacillus johnsonii]
MNNKRTKQNYYIDEEGRVIHKTKYYDEVILTAKEVAAIKILIKKCI